MSSYVPTYDSLRSYSRAIEVLMWTYVPRLHQAEHDGDLDAKLRDYFNAYLELHKMERRPTEGEDAFQRRVEKRREIMIREVMSRLAIYQHRLSSNQRALAIPTTNAGLSTAPNQNPNITPYYPTFTPPAPTNPPMPFNLPQPPPIISTSALPQAPTIPCAECDAITEFVEQMIRVLVGHGQELRDEHFAAGCPRRGPSL